MATYTSNYGWTKPSGSDNVDISVLNNNLDDQDSTIHDAFLNMAPPFSESSTYAVDDIVLYTTGLYKCHTAVVTPGSWTGSTNWQVYKLSEGGSGGGGTSNYNQLTNKPQINGTTLSGNKSLSDLGIMPQTGVVANPTGQTTDTLTALEVGGTKYAVGGGGEVKNLDNGMLSHSTDSDYIVVNLDVPLTAGKEYKITLRDPSYNYVSTKIIVWNGQVDVIFDGPAGATEYKIQLTQTTASLYNYGGTGWRDIYCDIVSDFSSESYNDLTNKPQINGVTLSGNKTTSDLGINADNVMMSDGVTSVEDAVDVVSGTFTAAENVTVLHSKVKKQLNIVSLDIFCQKNLTANQWNHVGDIPANFAPDTYNIYFPGLNDTDVGFFASRVQGTSIDVYPTVSGTKNFSLVTTYITTN